MAAIDTRLEVLVEGLDHPECAVWDPIRGCVWAGGEGGQLYRVDLDTRHVHEEAHAPGFVLGLAVDGRGRLAVCVSEGEISLCVADENEVRVVARGFTFPNFPAFAPDGVLYLSDSGRWAQNNGCVWRVDVDGSAAHFSTALPHFPNGCAVSPDGRFLWLVESYEPTVNRLDLGTGEVELVTRLDGTVPDGIALVENGTILVSCYRPDRIYHVGADGHAEVVADDPQGTLLCAPTNVCFVGGELDRVVSANLGRWHLTLLDLGLRGAPLHAPSRWAADA